MSNLSDLLLDILCRKERKNDYLRRIEEVRRDLQWIGSSPFSDTFTRHKGSKHEEDISDRVKALCDFAEISVRAWKSSGLADVMLEFGGAWRQLKARDCQECGQMAPWHKESCSTKSKTHVRVGLDAAHGEKGDGK